LCGRKRLLNNRVKQALDCSEVFFKCLLRLPVFINSFKEFFVVVALSLLRRPLKAFLLQFPYELVDYFLRNKALKFAFELITRILGTAPNPDVAAFGGLVGSALCRVFKRLPEPLLHDFVLPFEREVPNECVRWIDVFRQHQWS
jgi:hypothetical protein